MPNGNCRDDVLGRHELRLRRAAANHPQRVPRLTLGRPPDTASPARVLLASHRCSAGTAESGEMSLAHGATLLALLYGTALRRWDETVREVAVRHRPAVLCAKSLRRSGKWPCGTQSIPALSGGAGLDARARPVAAPQPRPRPSPPRSGWRGEGGITARSDSSQAVLLRQCSDVSPAKQR